MTRRVSQEPPSYPFVPKSNARLIPGQFWAVPLSNGRFACGRVLALPPRGMPFGGKTTVLVGLAGWCGDDPPTASSIAGARILDQGEANVRTIRETGGAILGFRPLGADRIRPRLTLSDNSPCPQVVRGFDRIGPATTSHRRRLEIGGVWGLRFIEVLAELRFVKGGVPARRGWTGGA